MQKRAHFGTSIATAIRRSLTPEATRALVEASVSCRLDYCCNSLLADVRLRRLQSVQNAAARLVCGARRHEHITPILARDTSSASSSSASDLQDGGAGMEVSTRRSATSPGRPLCAGGVYGRSSPVSLCSLRSPPDALDSDVHWPVQTWRVWSPNMEPRLFDRQTNALHIQDAPVPALDQCRLQLLQLWVSCTVVRRRPQLSGPNSIQQLARSTDRDSIAPVALAAKQQQQQQQQQPGCGVARSPIAPIIA